MDQRRSKASPGFGVALSVIMTAAAATSAETSAIFSSDMVLQRGKPQPVWGKGAPGEKVAVSFAGQSLETVVDAHGDWQVTLKPLAVQKTGSDLTVNGKAFTNVVVGDVWLVSGQSNAEMSFSWGIINGEAEMAKAKDFPNVRAVKFDHRASAYPVRYECPAGRWRVCTEKTLPDVTAMGYFFARDINARTGVPIGLLDANWSSSRIEPFVPFEGLATNPAFAEDLQKARADEEALRRHFERIRSSDYAFEDWQTSEPKPQSTWTKQHNAMIAPIVRFPITGALWYQGCSNWKNGYDYAPRLKMLVAGWRKAWGEEFPFYVVQLASFQNQTTDPAGGDARAPVREAQRLASLEIPKCGLAVTIDIGDTKDVHPKNKLDLGLRLARWARRDVYGEKDLVPSGPMFRSQRVADGKVRLSFDHVGSGLMVGVKEPNSAGVDPKPADITVGLKGFSVAGADKRWHPATAEIEGSEVVVSSPEVSDPVAVRYAFRGNPMGQCNLYNREGLPASPFRTDKW